MLVNGSVLTSYMPTCYRIEQTLQQDEIEVKLVRDNNTSKSKGGRPMSSNISRGVSDAKYECWFGVFPHISRTSDAKIKEVRIEVRALDQKFNVIQSLIVVVMTKLCNTISKMTNVISGGEQPSNDHKGRSRRSVSPLVHSQSKEPVSKTLEFGRACEKVVTLSQRSPAAPEMRLHNMRMLNMYEI